MTPWFKPFYSDTNDTNTQLTITSILTIFLMILIELSGRGDGLPYVRDGDARWKIRIRPLKETNLGMAQVLFNPKGVHAKTDSQSNQWFNCIRFLCGLGHQYDDICFFIWIFLYTQPLVTPEWVKILAFCPEHPKWDQNLQFMSPG